jgi:alpha-1,6-mannosyltransferase
MSLIVQVGNFLAPGTGGLRTAMDQVAHGYARRGHQVVQVLPGPERELRPTAFGTRAVLPAPRLPVTGYRVFPDSHEVRRLVHSVGPDRLELHDRSTLRGLGRWATDLGLPAVLVSHERFDRLLPVWMGGWSVLLGHRAERMVDHANRALARDFDRVVCPSSWAAQEYQRPGIDNLALVPLGVDLEEFRPDRASPRVRDALAPRGESLLVVVSRLSAEKRVDLAVSCVADLVRRGRRVRLLVVGQGPRRRALERQAEGLPVRFVGHLDDRHRMATILACADVAIAPGPVESFGLAALEALACGTPVVANAVSALPELLGQQGGLAAAGGARAFADCVEGLLDGPADGRRAARSRAERFGWDRTVEGLLTQHRLPQWQTSPVTGRPAG